MDHETTQNEDQSQTDEGWGLGDTIFVAAAIAAVAGGVVAFRTWQRRRLEAKVIELTEERVAEQIDLS